VWHRAGSDPACRTAAGRERVGVPAWVRLPAVAPGASADLPGTARAQHLPSGAAPPGGRRREEGERGVRPPDRRAPCIPEPDPAEGVG
jgi:hypothetical protein